MKQSTKWSTIALLFPQLMMTSVLLFGVFAGVVQSFGIIPALNLNTWTLDYYRDLFSNPSFLASLYFSLRIALVSSILSLLIGLFFCYIMLQFPKIEKRMLFTVQIPIIIPHLIVALFIIILFGKVGWLARLFYFLGFENAQSWFSSLIYDSKGRGVILAYLWKEVPFIIFYCYPLLRRVDKELGEAAETLGATSIQTFLKITVHLAKTTIITGFIMIFLYAFGAYELPNLLGPTLPRTLPELAYIEYTHPDLLNRPYAMAVNGVILAVSVILSLVILKLVNYKGGYYEKSNV